MLPSSNIPEDYHLSINMRWLNFLVKCSSLTSQSSRFWVSCIVLVRKRGGFARFCVDYRRVNDITKKDSYPLPDINDNTLKILSKYKLFPTLDLKSDYWQIKLHPEHREKTTLTTRPGFWQFKIISFRLCNALAMFERLIETVLSGLSYETCLVFLDDITIVERPFGEHLRSIRKVLEKLKMANLKLNLTKCNLFCWKDCYLRNIISALSVRAEPENLSRHEDVLQLRSFLGICTYYRKFIKDFLIFPDPFTNWLNLNRSSFGQKNVKSLLKG